MFLSQCWYIEGWDRIAHVLGGYRDGNSIPEKLKRRLRRDGVIFRRNHWAMCADGRSRRRDIIYTYSNILQAWMIRESSLDPHNRLY
jgi:hypothetical protein